MKYTSLNGGRATSSSVQNAAQTKDFPFLSPFSIVSVKRYRSLGTIVQLSRRRPDGRCQSHSQSKHSLRRVNVPMQGSLVSSRNPDW